MYYFYGMFIEMEEIVYSKMRDTMFKYQYKQYSCIRPNGYCKNRKM